MGLVHERTGVQQARDFCGWCGKLVTWPWDRIFHVTETSAVLEGSTTALVLMAPPSRRVVPGTLYGSTWIRELAEESRGPTS